MFLILLVGEIGGSLENLVEMIWQKCTDEYVYTYTTELRSQPYLPRYKYNTITSQSISTVNDYIQLSPPNLNQPSKVIPPYTSNS